MNAPFILRASVALEPEEPAYRVVIDQAAIDAEFWQIVTAALRQPTGGVAGPPAPPAKMVAPIGRAAAPRIVSPSERSPPPARQFARQFDSRVRVTDAGPDASRPGIRAAMAAYAAKSKDCAIDGHVDDDG